MQEPREGTRFQRWDWTSMYDPAGEVCTTRCPPKSKMLSAPGTLKPLPRCRETPLGLLQAGPAAACNRENLSPEGTQHSDILEGLGHAA
jgi:hypothetical protein